MSAPARGLSQVVIRPAEPEDLPVLGRLGALLVRCTTGSTLRASPPRREWTPYTPPFSRTSPEADGVVLVAERGGEVLGYTYATLEDSDYMALRGPAGLFHDLVVDPAHRGNGIGQMLLDATLAALKLAVRHGSCSRRRSGTPAPSASSHARGSGAR